MLNHRAELDCLGMGTKERCSRPRFWVQVFGYLAIGGSVLTALGTVLEPQEARSIEKPNVLLVTLDTTRADHLGSYGYALARTPNLDALASRGVRFARVDTAAPVTLPSHATILTGLFPYRHRVRDNGTFRLGAEFETLAERLQAAGYDTAAVIGSIVLAKRHGLDQGFRIYDDDLGSGYSLGTSVAERTAEEVVEAARQRLSELRRPFFLWVHFFDPHEEYRPPTRFSGGQQTSPHRLYDGEIAYVDEQLGRLLAELPQQTLVAVIGDHGEMLGEHGELTHGLLPFAGARRVPLIVAGPGLPSGVVYPCVVRTVDLFPSLLQVLGLPIPEGLDGRSLFPLAARCDRITYTEAFLPFFAYKWYPLRTLSDGRVLYLDAPKPSLYRLDTDPQEQNDLAPFKPELERAWAKRLERWLQQGGEQLGSLTAATSQLDAEQRAQLASLGYLQGGGSTGVPDRSLPDPRERLPIARALHEAARGVQEGRCSEVLPELRRISREDPRNFPALTLAAQCLRDLGRCAEAVPLYERAAREAEMSPIPAVNLGACLVTLGREAEAERELKRALVLDPTLSEAAVRLGRLLRERGRVQEAREVLDRALEAGARAAEVYLERGAVLAELGHLEPALRDFREAIRRNPADPVALENAARTSYLLHRPAEAALLYETLLERAPHRVAAWKALGSIYLEDLNDPVRARRSFQEALRREIDPAERERLTEVLRALDNLKEP